MRQPSGTAGQHSFAQVPSANIQRSQFNRSHSVKTTFYAGQLIPFLADEALPGDTLNLNASIFARLATPLFPVMDNLYLDSFYFSIPVRLIWENWQRFNGEQDKPGDSTDFLVPQVISNGVFGYGAHGLSDYLGLPTGIPNMLTSALWHRSYNIVWNQWFRDENLQDPAVEHTDDAQKGGLTDYPIRHRGKRHDFFTSCLPWAQKGPSVELPLGTTAPMTMDADQFPSKHVGFPPRFDYDNQTNQLLKVISSNKNVEGNSAPGTSGNLEFSATPGNSGLKVDGLTGTVDLSSATASTINAIRLAFQIQKLYEKDARGGTRYTEMIRSHFGVISPDARLQRVEFLGGASTPVDFQQVQQSAPATGESPDAVPGSLSAYATAYSSGGGFRKSFTEHCIILGLVCVRADLTYQQGIERQFLRRTRFDFFLPTLAHLGEQVVQNQEIYCQGNDTDFEAFGYQERYAEYRYKPSLTTGLMRSQAMESLDAWHLAQDFTSLPILGDAFIQENPPMARISAVPSEPDFIMSAFFTYKAARPMPVFSVPGLIDHF